MRCNSESVPDLTGTFLMIQTSNRHARHLQSVFPATLERGFRSAGHVCALVSRKKTVDILRSGSFTCGYS